MKCVLMACHNIDSYLWLFTEIMTKFFLEMIEYRSFKYRVMHAPEFVDSLSNLIRSITEITLNMK